jgi:16S rRNA (uracil1498-N3)-methyltransferase
LDQPLAKPLQQCAPLTPQIGLAMAVPRRDGELVWRMATEIGVDHLQPLMAERTQGRQAWPLERWSTILQEAAEQCERLWLPRLEAPRSALELLAEAPTGLGLIATTRRPVLPLLEEILAAGSKAPEAAPEALGAASGASTERKAQWLPQSVTLAIGPEGGWSDQELATAEDSGWLAVSLGEPILRTATAAIAGVSRMASWRALSCASSPSPSP